MPLDRLNQALDRHLGALRDQGTAKGAESVVVGVAQPFGGYGPRYILAGRRRRAGVAGPRQPRPIQAHQAGAGSCAHPGHRRSIVGRRVGHHDLARRRIQGGDAR
jgi:hypothetical protein